MHSRFARFAAARQVRFHLLALFAVQHAQRVQLINFLELFAGHAIAASVSSSRRILSALRTQVFTVPSGCFICSAISVCENPSKYASSITIRWLSFSFSKALFNLRDRSIDSALSGKSLNRAGFSTRSSSSALANNTPTTE